MPRSIDQAVRAVGGRQMIKHLIHCLRRKIEADPAARADEYLNDLRATGLPDYRATPGNRGVQVLCRAEGDVVHFVLLTLWESETGASIWSRSASATRTLGQVSVYGGKDLVFDADDPERAYGDLVDFLVNRVAADLQGSWQTQ